MAKPLTAKNLCNRLIRLQDKGGDIIEKIRQWGDEFEDMELNDILQAVADNLETVIYDSPGNGSGLADAIEFIQNELMTDEEKYDDFD